MPNPFIVKRVKFIEFQIYHVLHKNVLVNDFEPELFYPGSKFKTEYPCCGTCEAISKN